MYTSIDRVLASFNRNIVDSDVSESDLIEWIAEAMGFLRVNSIQEKALAFLRVKDYHSIIPEGFHSVIQIARNLKWNEEVHDETQLSCSPNEILEEINIIKNPNKSLPCPIVTDCQGNLIGDYEVSYYRPYFDLKWEYELWSKMPRFQHDYRPVRLANSTLFGSLVCKEDKSIYTGNEDEYDIVGTTDMRLRFSFKEGEVVMAYNRTAIDPTTGYPLIPDNEICIVALTYYLKWKLAERLSWSGRQGFTNEADRAEQRWLKYARQYKNYEKMPKTLDDYQDHMDLTTTMFKPNKYYNFFGKTKKTYY